MADALEVRIAHLDGAHEQISKLLAAVEAAVSQLRQEISQVRQGMREQFRWILGFQILS